MAAVVAAGAFAVVNNRSSKSENTEINLISGLEGVGSGFYYDDAAIHKEDLFVLDGEEIETRYHEGVGDVAVFKPAGWEHLIFGVPTVGSIQYYQLKTIVEVYLNDANYTDGTTKKLTLVAADLKDGTVGDGKVGYTVTQGSAARIKEVTGLSIGVTWEPQFSALVIGDGHPFENLITTDQLFPHVTCCVLYGNAEYIENNKDTAERLVWAVKNATDWLNWVVEDINANGYDASKPSHQALVDYAIKHAGGVSSGLTKEQVLNAFKYIEYAWGDEKTGSFDSNNPMSHIKSDIATQTDTLYDMGGLVNNSLSDLGFKDSAKFADKFVDDSLIKAIREKASYDTSDKLITITLSVIVNDLHQLPTHLADEKLPGLSTLKPGLSEERTLYSQAGLNVKFIDATGSNGVVTALTSNQAQFGVAAEPAVIIYDINNKQTTA
ncbi:MAG: hypothetical protein IJ810_01170 [Candidatus Methanomethylophilus sp.]|nr:hypothetical protein [Methanomethylophilus sp.]